MNRRAALELSMQSIIIFVLAIIVMSSLVVAVRTILNKVSPEKIDETIGTQQVPFKAATYDSPFTIGTSGDQIILKSIDTKKLGFDLYAKEDITAPAPVTFTLGTCYDENGDETTLSDKLVFSKYIISKTLSQGDSLGGGVITLRAKGVKKGVYTCLLTAEAGNTQWDTTVTITVK